MRDIVRLKYSLQHNTTQHTLPTFEGMLVPRMTAVLTRFEAAALWPVLNQIRTL